MYTHIQNFPYLVPPTVFPPQPQPQPRCDFCARPGVLQVLHGNHRKTNPRLNNRTTYTLCEQDHLCKVKNCKDLRLDQVPVDLQGYNHATLLTKCPYHAKRHVIKLISQRTKPDALAQDGPIDIDGQNLFGQPEPGPVSQPEPRPDELKVVQGDARAQEGERAEGEGGGAGGAYQDDADRSGGNGSFEGDFGAGGFEGFGETEDQEQQLASVQPPNSAPVPVPGSEAVPESAEPSVQSALQDSPAVEEPPASDQEQQPHYISSERFPASVRLVGEVIQLNENLWIAIPRCSNAATSIRELMAKIPVGSKPLKDYEYFWHRFGPALCFEHKHLIRACRQGYGQHEVLRAELPAETPCMGDNALGPVFGELHFDVPMTWETLRGDELFEAFGPKSSIFTPGYLYQNKHWADTEFRVQAGMVLVFIDHGSAAVEGQPPGHAQLLQYKQGIVIRKDMVYTVYSITPSWIMMAGWVRLETYDAEPLDTEPAETDTVPLILIGFCLELMRQTSTAYIEEHADKVKSLLQPWRITKDGFVQAAWARVQLVERDIRKRKPRPDDIDTSEWVRPGDFDE